MFFLIYAFKGWLINFMLQAQSQSSYSHLVGFWEIKNGHSQIRDPTRSLSNPNQAPSRATMLILFS
jgi:hypothetical protein